MNIGRAFSFVFEDKSWITKVLIGGALILVPILGLITMIGYSYKIAQNTARGVELPMPEWNEFGDILIKGLLGAVIAIIYSLPFSLLMSCISAVLTGATADRSGDPSATGAALSLCLLPINLAGSIFFSLLATVATAHYLASDDFGAAFRVNTIWNSFKNNLGDWFMVFLVSILAVIVGFLGLIALVIGALFTFFYGYCVVGHAMGQAMQRVGLVPGTFQPATVSGPPPAYPQ